MKESGHDFIKSNTNDKIVKLDTPAQPFKMEETEARPTLSVNSDLQNQPKITGPKSNGPSELLDPLKSPIKFSMEKGLGVESPNLITPVHSLTLGTSIKTNSQTVWTGIGKEDEARRNLGKQISKIKYYWRGTNANYPFAFQRVRIKHGSKKQQVNFDDNLFGKRDELETYSNDSGSNIIYEEDFSNKAINPSEKFFK